MAAAPKDTEEVDDEGGEIVPINGKSIEERAADGEAEEPEDDGTMQLVVPGTGTKLSTTAGGKKPTESYFKMSAVALSIAGDAQVEKDTELWIAVPVAIDEVHFANRRKDGEIVAVKRVHHGKAIGQPVILDKPPVALD